MSGQSKGAHYAQHWGRKQTRGTHPVPQREFKEESRLPARGGYQSHLKNQGYLWTSWQQHRHQEGNSTVLKFCSKTITNLELYR